MPGNGLVSFQSSFIDKRQRQSNENRQQAMFRTPRKVTVDLISASKNIASKPHISSFSPQVLFSSRLTKSSAQPKFSKFKQQLDTRLSTAYSLLKNKKTKNLQLDQRRYDLKVNDNLAYEQVPYDVVKEYIDNVYEEYSIKDPMGNTGNRHGGSAYNSTKKKIQILKNNFLLELNSQTLKKPQISAFWQHPNSKQTNPKKPLFPISPQQPPHLPPKKLIRMTLRRSSKQHPTPLSQTKLTLHPPQQIPILFRYCFVCQQPILESNMEHHQGKCVGLRELIRRERLGEEDILGMVRGKVGKLEGRLRSTFLDADEAEIFNRIREVKNGLNSIVNNQQSQQHQHSANKYSTVTQSLKKTQLLQSFELINKLKWFTVLRKNLQQRIAQNNISQSLAGSRRPSQSLSYNYNSQQLTK